MIDRNHPAVEAAARDAYERAWGTEGEPWDEASDLERNVWRADETHALTAALPHLTADDLRHTPAGRELMREAAVNARSPRPHWNSTPDGTVYDAHLLGDEVRARNLDARCREAMLNMRESDEGRALMAETWQEGAMAHAAATSYMTPETRRIINELMKAANPYLDGGA